jgi:hypothetical protein
MVETALFVSATLIFMLGVIQIGVLGYLQLTTDAAAYYDARANVLTVTSGTPEQATNTAFPQIPVADIVPQVLPAPTPTIEVDYGYNDPNPTVRANSASNRHGGASLMQPEQLQTTINVPGLMHILGNALGVNGVATEAKWVECGTHDDIANEGCSLASPGPDSQNNYITQGENTPPYFVGFNYMQDCALAQPWGVYTGQGDSALDWSNPIATPDGTTSAGSGTYYSIFGSWNGAQPSSPGGAYGGAPPSSATYTWSQCANGATSGNENIGFIAMGVGGFLDSTNWSDTSPGVSGACASSNGTGQSVFEAFAFHQRTYATIAEYLQANPYQPYVEINSQEADSTSNPNNNVAFFGLAGAWHNTAGSGNIAIPEAITTFGTGNSSGFGWEGFNDSSHYYGNTDTWNAAVHTVYSWDVSVGQGQPPNDPTYSNPTTPEAGCT